MQFGIPDLNVEHPVVKAGRLMQDVYHKYDGMAEPCQIVHKQFPQLSPEQIMCLWVGVNMAECSLEDLDKIELVETESN